jgi:hypothetical protein
MTLSSFSLGGMKQCTISVAGIIQSDMCDKIGDMFITTKSRGCFGMKNPVLISNSTIYAWCSTILAGCWKIIQHTSSNDIGRCSSDGVINTNFGGASKIIYWRIDDEQYFAIEQGMSNCTSSLCYAAMSLPCYDQRRKRDGVSTTSESDNASACCTSWRVVLFHFAAWAITICIETNTDV